jgi:hypothetical protein
MDTELLESQRHKCTHGRRYSGADQDADSPADRREDHCLQQELQVDIRAARSYGLTPTNFLVRSVTEMSMMCITPIPPTRRPIELITAVKMTSAPVSWFHKWLMKSTNDLGRADYDSGHTAAFEESCAAASASVVVGLSVTALAA